MTKEPFLNQLFDAHTKDLNDFRPDMGDFFVCPICLSIIPREAISQKFLTDGHVWPKSLRETSKLANSMHVLLCNKCNNTAGSRGDRQMQLFEMVRKGDETGELYGNRLVQVIDSPGKKPIKMNVKVTRNLNDGSMTVTGRVDNDLNWLEGSPEDRASFQDVYGKGKQVRVVVNQYKEFKPELVRVGWVTSAYLMAFYHLGYWYILHKSLEPVRNYILQSFDPEAIKNLTHPDYDNFTVREYESLNFLDPELLFIYPLENNQHVYLRVNCLKFEIRLPFRYSRPVFEWLMRKWMPDFDEKLPELKKAGEYLMFPIKQTKSDGNISLYDYLMGKPIPKKQAEK